MSLATRLTESEDFWSRLIDRANGAAFEYDCEIKLVKRVSDDEVWVTMTGEDDNEETSAAVKYLGEHAGHALIEVMEDGDSHVVSASGLNLFRCLYV